MYRPATPGRRKAHRTGATAARETQYTNAKRAICNRVNVSVNHAQAGSREMKNPVICSDYISTPCCEYSYPISRGSAHRPGLAGWRGMKDAAAAALFNNTLIGYEEVRQLF